MENGHNASIYGIVWNIWTIVHLYLVYLVEKGLLLGFIKMLTLEGPWRRTSQTRWLYGKLQG